jgi:hypothetical protein
MPRRDHEGEEEVTANPFRAHILEDGQNFVRDSITVMWVMERQDGTQEFVLDMPRNGCPTMGVYVRGGPNPDDPDFKPLEFTFPREAWLAICEQVNRHFGKYEGIDYERLKRDYDRQAEELRKANEFIRNTLETVLTRRAAYNNKEGEKS